MKIYTKKGDKGETSLLSGTKVPKSHIRLDAYGTIDELNSFIGLLRDQISISKLKEDLLSIQNTLFVVGSHLATDKQDIKTLPILREEIVLNIEQLIDSYEEKLEPLSSFILPGGHISVSTSHIARNVCRRAERLITKVSENEHVSPLIIKYINRLSDYFFVFSRLLAKELKIVEIKWEHKLNK